MATVDVDLFFFFFPFFFVSFAVFFSSPFSASRSFSVDATPQITVRFLSLSLLRRRRLFRKHSLTQLLSTHIILEVALSYTRIQAHLTV
jgi:hypothetical protein